MGFSPMTPGFPQVSRVFSPAARLDMSFAAIIPAKLWGKGPLPLTWGNKAFGQRSQSARIRCGPCEEADPVAGPTGPSDPEPF